MEKQTDARLMARYLAAELRSANCRQPAMAKALLRAGTELLRRATRRNEIVRALGERLSKREGNGKAKEQTDDVNANKGAKP